MKIGRIISFCLILFSASAILSGYALAKGQICPRPAPGSTVEPPPDLYSSNGVLNVSFLYETAVDQNGLTLLCFMTPDGLQSPTLHVNPGDTLNVTLTNALAPIHGGPQEVMSSKSQACGSVEMTLTSVNLHFHGTNTSPKCHSDEVIHTLVNSGETFKYSLKFPKDEPPGLYWYHPHVHGISSMSVQGGASGAIVVDGIENIQPAVAGLPQRVLLIRDQPLPWPVVQSTNAPFWDLSVNYVAVPYPKYPPAIIKMQSGKQEFWRLANASANSILDLQIKYDGKAQPVQVAAIDGVPTGSQDGKREGTLLTYKHLLIPPAGRIEFIVTAPDASVKQAELVTNYIDSGPAGDYLPSRRLALIKATNAADALPKMPMVSHAPNMQRFEGLDDAKVTAQRKLYFDEVFIEDFKEPPGKPLAKRKKTPDDDKHMLFFITVDGQVNHVFDPNNPPDIVTHRGAVEEWTIENHTTELHEFHMHQIHFKLLEVNGVRIPKNQRQFYDTVQVPYWDGVSQTYPSVKVLMDFRGPTVGDFVYHCHILDHEDGGMMAIIRVKPPKA